MRHFATITTAVFLLFATATAGADRDKDSADRPEPGAGLTIYMDISVLGRKGRAAKRMTKLHEEQFEKGWTVVDVDPYIENGDLQGFFVTYVGRK